MTNSCVYSSANGGLCVTKCSGCVNFSQYEMEVPMSISPHLVFKEELSQIFDDRVLYIVNHILRIAPLYFYIIPASTTGKYHSKQDLGIQGLVRHTRSDVRVLLEVCKNEAFGIWTDYEIDVAIAALILHDCVKCGFDGSDHTVHTHPILVKGLCPDFGDDECNKIWDDITSLIASHSGQWTKDKYNPEAQELPRPQTPLQKLVHQCDYIASRKVITIDLDVPFVRERPKKASQDQMKYLYDLTEMIKQKGREVPEEVLKYDFSDPKSVDISKFINLCKDIAYRR